MARWKPFAIYCLTLVVAIEVSARIDSAIDLLIEGHPFASIQIADDIGIRGKPNGTWRQIRLNRFGFHDTDDMEVAKTAGKIRVMCLGDSVAFGTHTAPVNWPGLLEEILQSDGLTVEVINASMPGNSWPQILARFERDLLIFKPDIVLISKDFRHYMALGAPGGRPSASWLETTARLSVFIDRWMEKRPADPHGRLLDERRRKGIEHPIERIDESSIDAYRRDVERLADLCKREGITPVLSSFPALADRNNINIYRREVEESISYYPALTIEAYLDGTPRFNAATREVADRRAIAHIDVAGSLDRSRENFLDNSHLTIRGARRVAAIFADALRPIIAGIPSHFR